MDYSLVFSKRKVECTVGLTSTVLSFDIASKHNIAQYADTFRSPPFLASCNFKNQVGKLRSCVNATASVYLKTLPTNVKFLLVLREPLAVLESTYFHLTEPKAVSQTGLDSFAMAKSRYLFSNIAARFILHSEYLREKTLFWYYDVSSAINAESILRLYSIDEKISKALMDIATISSNTEIMYDIEKLGFLPVGGAKNGKVRLNHNISISKDVATNLTAEFKNLFPKELRNRWFS